MFYYFLYADSKILRLFVQYSTLMVLNLREVGNCFANIRDRNGILKIDFLFLLVSYVFCPEVDFLRIMGVVFCNFARNVLMNMN